MVQEAIIALWRTRERVLPLPKLQQAALVWRIAHNAVVDCLRRTEDTQALREDYDEAAEDNSLVRELHEQIALLDEPNRTIVRMQLEGYSYEEIGEELGISVKNVSVRLVRIKEELRKKMTL
jgi:RNA polymerase sigma-70 factor (ECF subfamily)